MERRGVVRKGGRRAQRIASVCVRRTCGIARRRKAGGGCSARLEDRSAAALELRQGRALWKKEEGGRRAQRTESAGVRRTWGIARRQLSKHPLLLATCSHALSSPPPAHPCARPLMLRRPIQAHKSMFARAPVHACAAATRAYPFLLARDPVHAYARLTRAHAAACAPPTPEHPPL
jgi:hypothetical protein